MCNSNILRGSETIGRSVLPKIRKENFGPPAVVRGGQVEFRLNQSCTYRLGRSGSEELRFISWASCILPKPTNRLAAERRDLCYSSSSMATPCQVMELWIFIDGVAPPLHRHEAKSLTKPCLYSAPRVLDVRSVNSGFVHGDLLQKEINVCIRHWD